jgi:hypothetical protein
MNGKIHAPIRKSFLNLLGEHPLGTNLGEGDLLQAIACRLDDLYLDQMTLAAEKRSDVVCLPESQLRASAPDA